MLIEMTGTPKSPAELLVDLRSTCQLVLLHPWFNRGCRSPAFLFEPRSREDLDCLLNNLSIVTEIVCLHRDHADRHREVHEAMMAQVVGALNAPVAESTLLKFLGSCDLRGIEQELSRLRLLVKNSWADSPPALRPAA